MNTPTPETDECYKRTLRFNWADGVEILLKLARKLECERDAARKDAWKYKGQFDTAIAATDYMRSDRDLLKAELTQLRKIYENSNKKQT